MSYGFEKRKTGSVESIELNKTNNMNSFINLFSKTQKEYGTIECAELEDVIKAEGSKIGLIDCRTKGEHNNGHIPNSEHIDLASPDFASKLSFLDKEKSYYVYCASGNRSRTACSQMVNMGFKNIYNVRMGMMGWSGKVE